MKIYKKNNVFEESLERIRFLFNEFEEVIVCISGGKDSTIVYELAMMVAKEKNRLPLNVLFIDQEAEWEATIDMVKDIMYNKNVKPYWLQCPIKLFNGTSIYEDWLYCWDENKKAKWMREKDAISIKENIFGTDRFKEIFKAFIVKEFKDIKACTISGVRTEESPGRYLGCTNDLTYKNITWGLKYNQIQFNFHPIYDWSYRDVWKSILDNKWRYNKVYDYQYRYGVGINNMRVSNLHHETALRNLFYLQEVEPKTYEKLTSRLSGIDACAKLSDDYFVKELPYMFKDWREYKEYLLEKLIIDESKRNIFKKQFKRFEDKFLCAVDESKIYKAEIQTILANDYYGTKLQNMSNKFGLDLKDYKRKNNL